MEHKSVIEAVNAVMQDVGYVKKESSRGLNYSYAGESALISAIRPSMVEHGIIMYVSRILTNHTEVYETKSGTSMNRTIITGEVAFAIPGDMILVQAVGEGADAGDKASGKAMTNLYKYAMRQTFCIETGDDPDKSPSQDQERSKRQEPPKAEKKPQPKGKSIDPKINILIEGGIAENVPNAAGILNKMPPEVWSNGPDEVLKLGLLYRTERDDGKEPDDAMECAINTYNGLEE